MSYPKNPETVIIKNKYYPKGISEIDIWNYYSKNKNHILNEVRNKDVLLVIFSDINKPIIKRKISGKYIKLTNNNYDEIITGRTVSLYSVVNYYSDFAIVDIDTDTVNEAKMVAYKVYMILLGASFIQDLSIRYTGKTGFHIICKFNKSSKIDTYRTLLQNYLSYKDDIVKNYTISPKRTKGIPNIDLWAVNKRNGAYITLHSLSIIGLKCMEVQPLQLKNFRPENAMI